MHSAPAVAYPVRRSRVAGLCLLAACGLSVSAMALWFLQVRSGWPVWLGGFCCVLGCIWGWLAWRAMPVGTLAWDGEVWQFTPVNALLPNSPALSCNQIAVVLDLQCHLLLQWPSCGAARWLWIDQSSQPQRWHALRCAVYSPARYARGSPVPGAATAAP